MRVVWECSRGGGGVWCIEVYQETGFDTRAGHTTRRGHNVGATKVKGHMTREGPGAMKEGSRVTRPPPQYHNAEPNHRRQGRGGGSNEELKENKTR